MTSLTPGVYRHYKGALYRVLFLAKDSSNDPRTADEDVVVYVALYGEGRVSVRPAREFFEPVDTRNTSSGPEPFHMGPRFRRVGD